MPAPARDEYGSVARLYDPLTAALLDPLRRRVASEAVNHGAKSAVDLCCGTGRQLTFLHDAGLRAAGIDLSPAMLGQARRHCPRAVELVQADATATPWPDASFSLCTIAFALHERPRAVRLGLLAEARRLLAPGGTILVLDYRVPRRAAQRLGHLGVWVFERAAGGEHYANYGRYLREGGMPPLAAKAGLSCALRESFFLGAVGLYALAPLTGI